MIFTKEELIVSAISTMWFIGAIVASVIVPFVSLLAIPFFAFKAFLKWIEHRSYDKKTLTSGTEDAESLDQELTRKEKKDVLDKDLRMLRALSKALIPIIGYFWVQSTEDGHDGALTSFRYEDFFKMIMLGIGAIAASAIAPFVSLLAVPFFAFKAFPKWIKHRSFYKMTLTNGTREKYGRVPGQDYTRWDGKAVVRDKTKKIIWAERMHELMDEYMSGVDYDFFTLDEGASDCPFRAKEDASWLDREFTRREKKSALDKDLRMLRAFSKALIPIIGVIWVLSTETGPGGASSFGCSACMLMSIAGDAREVHWGWADAIEFHLKILKQNLEQ